MAVWLQAKVRQRGLELRPRQNADPFCDTQRRWGGICVLRRCSFILNVHSSTRSKHDIQRYSTKLNWFFLRFSFRCCGTIRRTAVRWKAPEASWNFVGPTTSLTVLRSFCCTEHRRSTTACTATCIGSDTSSSSTTTRSVPECEKRRRQEVISKWRGHVRVSVIRHWRRSMGGLGDMPPPVLSPIFFEVEIKIVATRCQILKLKCDNR